MNISITVADYTIKQHQQQYCRKIIAIILFTLILDTVKSQSVRCSVKY